MLTTQRQLQLLVIALTFVPLVRVSQAGSTRKPGLKPGKWQKRLPSDILVQMEARLSGGPVQIQAIPPGTQIKKQVGPSIFRVGITDGSSLQSKIDELRSWPGVAMAEPNYPVELARKPNDPIFRRKRRFGQGYLSRMKARKAWKLTTGKRGKRGVTICVIDSGLDVTHPDLAANVAEPPGISTLDMDPSVWDTLKQNSSWYLGVSTDITDGGHGSLVAGVAAAVGNNRKGITGVAWEASLVACKSFPDLSGGYVSDILPCLDYCRIRKAKVITAAWGLPDDSDILRRATRDALSEGALMVAAAGNYATNNDALPFYPASWTNTIQGVISVGATRVGGRQARYSNFGRTSVDLFAVGNVWTTFPRDVDWNFFVEKYGTIQGTSFSAPMVGGAAALMASVAKKELSGAELKQMLMDTVQQQPWLKNKCKTGGELNIGRAVFAAARRCYPGETCQREGIGVPT